MMLEIMQTSKHAADGSIHHLFLEVQKITPPHSPRIYRGRAARLQEMVVRIHARESGVGECGVHMGVDIDDSGNDIVPFGINHLVCKQKSSGRCWMFAGLNLIREKIAKKCNIEQFELSQNFKMFWDKFEKANYFLECILETLDEPVEGRLVTWLLQNACVDGGQWDMFVNLVDKYGVVPKDAMPETHGSSNTGLMNQLVTVKLRKCAIELRNHAGANEDPDSLHKIKDGMLREIYALLCIFLGEPPTGFDFEYKDKELGVMDADLYRYDLALDMSFDLAKSERLDCRESCMTHAMVFTGVNRKCLSEEMLKLLAQKPIVLEPWDPMGSLA